MDKNVSCFQVKTLLDFRYWVFFLYFEMLPNSSSKKKVTIKILVITLASAVEKMHLRKFTIYNICCTDRLISKTKITILF